MANNANKKEAGKRISRLVKKFSDDPKSVAKKEREELKTALRKKEKKGTLDGRELAVFRDLTKRRRFLKYLLGSVVLAGAGVKGYSLLQPSEEEVRDAKLLEAIESGNHREVVEHFAETTDEEISLSLDTILEWQQLFNERSHFVVNPIIREDLKDTLGFLQGQLMQGDNNYFRDILNHSDVTEENIEMVANMFSTGHHIFGKDRIADLTRYDHIWFAFSDIEAAIKLVATYTHVDATIKSGQLIRDFPIHAVLTTLNMANRALVNKLMHDKVSIAIGNKVEEHHALDLALAKNSGSEHIRGEKQAHAIEFEMANIIANNSLRQKAEMGGGITSKDYSDVHYPDLEDGVTVDTGRIAVMTALMDAYFKAGDHIKGDSNYHKAMKNVLKTYGPINKFDNELKQ